MSADILTLLIAGGTGCFVGVVIAVPIMGLIATAKARRAEKDAWKSANIYYTRNQAQP